MTPRLDRLWLALWVPLAFVLTFLIIKWIIWSFDPVTVVAAAIIGLFFLVRVFSWMGDGSPY